MKYSKHQNDPDYLKTLPPDEPFFVLRAQYRLSVQAVMAYAEILHKVGENIAFNPDLTEEVAVSLALSLSDQATEVAEIAQSFEAWQKANPEKVKYPD